MTDFKIKENELCRIIENAPKQILSIAKKKGNSGQKSYGELKNKQWKHRKLSQSWVKYLGQSLEKYYQNNICENIYAFPSQYDLKKKLGIKQSEFLFDVSVGLYKSFKSKKFESSKKVLPIHYQSKPIWQIESELAEDTRKIAIDFSKLFAGNADNAMIVSPKGKEKTNYYMNEMKKMVELNGWLSQKTLYFLILPHPRDWVDDKGNWNNESEWYFFKWYDYDWEIVEEGKWIFNIK